MNAFSISSAAASMVSAARRFAAAIAVGVVALAAPLAGAVDRVTSTTGEVYEGEIVRELKDPETGKVEAVIIRVLVGGLSDLRTLAGSEIASIERDSDSTALIEEDQTGMVPEPEAVPASRPGAARALVLTLEGTVGIQFAAESIEQMLPTLERELGTDRSGVLVLKINSGGGLLLEIQKFSDFVEEELKTRFRVVAWIESAISAAAMSAHCIPEIYFMPEGNYGACTGWSGALKAVEGRQLIQVRQMMERISARGGYDPKIMNAMQIMVPLSYSVDSRGNVTFYDSTEGQHLLNPEGRILTLTASEALACGFSRGTADNIQELAQLLRIPELEWVGRSHSEFAYPVSRSEELMMEYRRKTTLDEARFQQYVVEYQLAVQYATATPREDRGKFVGRARSALRKIGSMIDRNFNFALLQFGILDRREWDEWMHDRMEELDEMMRG